MKTFLFFLTFFSASLLGAQSDCVSNEQTHFEAEMPMDSIEWFFIALDAQHTQASLTFPSELNEALFYQVIAQNGEDAQYDYAFSLEALDNPLTTDAKQIEFIISNEQLADLVIHIQYLDPGYLECTDKKSYSYFVKAS